MPAQPQPTLHFHLLVVLICQFPTHKIPTYKENRIYTRIHLPMPPAHSLAVKGDLQRTLHRTASSKRRQVVTPADHRSVVAAIHTLTALNQILVRSGICYSRHSARTCTTTTGLSLVMYRSSAGTNHTHPSHSHEPAAQHVQLGAAPPAAASMAVRPACQAGQQCRPPYPPPCTPISFRTASRPSQSQGITGAAQAPVCLLAVMHAERQSGRTAKSTNPRNMPSGTKDLPAGCRVLNIG